MEKYLECVIKKIGLSCHVLYMYKQCTRDFSSYLVKLTVNTPLIGNTWHMTSSHMTSLLGKYLEVVFMTKKLA